MRRNKVFQKTKQKSSAIQPSCMFKALLLAAIILVSIPVQTTASRVADNVSALSTAYSSQRKIVRDSKGDLFVIYLRPDGNLSQVYMSESMDDGATWEEIGRVSEGEFNSVRLSLAIDAADRVHVFWTKFIEEYGQIFQRIYDRGTWSAEQQITSAEGYSGFPSVAVDSKGVLHLVWYGFDGSTYQVYYSRSEGGNWSKPVKLSQGFPDSVNPTIAVDSKDNLHVAWYKSTGRQYQIYYVRWAGSWSDQVSLSLGTTDSFNPSLAVDPKDNIYVAWEKVEGQTWQIYYSVYRQGEWSPQYPLTSGSLSSQNPSVGTDLLGTVYVFYEKTDGQIYLRKYSESWSDEVALTSSGMNTFPSVRWSYNNNPFNGEGGKIEYVWTSEENGQLSVKYSSLPIARAAELPATNLVEFASAGAIIVALLGVSVILVLYRRRKKR